MKKFIFLLYVCFIPFNLFSQILFDDYAGVQVTFSGDTLYFINSVGDTAALFDLENKRFGFNELAPKTGIHISQKSTYTTSAGFKITTDNSGELLADGFDIFFDSSNNLYLSNRETGFIRFDTGAIERFRIDADGKITAQDFVRRQEIINLDVISFFPPADSGAVLDTLNNRIEVLTFYDATDSVNVFNTFQLNSYVSQVDSFQLYFQVPSGFTLGDSISFGLGYRIIDESAVYDISFTVLDTIHYVLGGLDGVKDLIHMSWVNGLSGESENSLIDLWLYRVNGFVNNPPVPVQIRRLRIFVQ